MNVLTKFMFYSLAMKDSTVKNLQEQLSSVQQQLNVEKSKQHQQSDLIKRLQRKLLLVTKVTLHVL